MKQIRNSLSQSRLNTRWGPGPAVLKVPVSKNFVVIIWGGAPKKGREMERSLGSVVSSPSVVQGEALA